MSNSNGQIRKRVVGLVVAAGLVALAGAAPQPQALAIFAPVDVIAGNPINGYVTGSDDLCVITASSCGPSGFFLIGLPVVGIGDKINFVFPTLECQAPGIVNIRANDTDETASRSVILK